MRSQLTRRVFQRIIRNEPLLHRGCNKRLLSTTARPTIVSTKKPINYTQRRDLWWKWSQGKTQRVLKPEKVDPGIEMMLEQEIVLDHKVRKYSNIELLAALRTFFRHKESIQKSVLDTQIKAVLATYKYLLSEREHEPDLKLTVEESALALRRLKSGRLSETGGNTDTNVDSFVALADLLFQDIKNRESEWPSTVAVMEDSSGETSGQAPLVTDEERLDFFRKCTQSYVSVLAFRLKDGLHVKNVFMELVKDYPSFAKISTFSKVVAWALSYTGNAQELNTFVQWTQETFSRLLPSVWTGIIEGAIVAKNLQAVKDWWPRRPEDTALSNVVNVDIAVLKLCIQSGEMKWGQPVLNKLVDTKFKQESLRCDQMIMILTWAMNSGKDVDELGQMLDLLCSRLELVFRTQDLNNLLELAKIKNDAYYADRLLNLGRKKNLQFDALTYRLEIEWRLLAGDVAGAQSAYKQLREQEFESDESSSIINKLILAMCAKNPVQYEDIMKLVEDLSELEGTFSAEMVSALSKIHLERGELHDLADLLRTHAASFNTAERELVRSTFENYIMTNDSAGAKWDGYTILKSIFPETTRNMRLKIMQEFFKVNRHDLAMHVFSHMRSSWVKNRRPNSAAYAMLFEGIAFARKPPALEIAHNMLRLDIDVDPDTAIKTSLMLAYTMCDRPGKALAIWDEVMYTREGPTYDTINIALRACQEWHEGLEYARNIWKQLRSQDVDIPKETADSYIAALAAQNDMDEAIRMVNELRTLSGGRYTYDALTIVATINPAGGQARQQARKWAEEEHPELMKQIEAAGTSPYHHRYLVEPLLPGDGSYKGRWSLVATREWELEYIDWSKLQVKYSDED